MRAVQIRESIRALFPDRDCCTLVRPLNDERDLQRLDHIPVKRRRCSSSTLLCLCHHFYFLSVPVLLCCIVLLLHIEELHIEELTGVQFLLICVTSKWSCEEESYSKLLLQPNG